MKSQIPGVVHEKKTTRIQQIDKTPGIINHIVGQGGML